MKILYNIHWFIIAYSIYNSYGKYMEESEIITEKRDTLQVYETKFLSKKKKLKAFRLYEQEKEMAKNKFKEVDEEFQASRSRLPSAFDHLGNKSLFDGVAKKLRIIDLAVVDNEPEVDHQSHFQKRYILSGRGTYLQFLIFLERISQSNQIFSIDSLSLKRLESKQRRRFQQLEGKVAIKAYRYNERYSLELDKKGTKKK